MHIPFVDNDLLAVLCPESRAASLVLDAIDASVAFANSTCIRLLRSASNIRVVDNRLVFNEPDINRAFRARLATLIRSGNEVAYLIWRDQATHRWARIAIRNHQGFYRDGIRGRRGEARQSHLVVVDFVREDDRPDDVAIGSFAEAASLTPAERTLLQLLVTNLTLREAAAARRAALSTVRQQMKGILAKTGCNRQSQLMSLIYTLCPAQDVTP